MRKIEIRRRRGYDSHVLVDEKGDAIQDIEILRRICRCVNSHDALVELLEDILEWDGILPHSKTRIKQALKQAESEE